MPDQNPEETFTFVDKRKVSADTTDASSPTMESAAASSDDLAELDGDESEGGSASYGLVAYVIGMMASEAWQKLGLVADPTTGKAAVDFEQARFCIDCVSVLVGVIDNHAAKIPDDLRRDLQRVLSDLRLNYLEQSKRQSAIAP